MKRTLWTAGLILTLMAPLVAQEKVKNLILMIPDGTSSSILSLARWYRYGNCLSDHCRLAVDPHVCGLVSTCNSDSPFGDSAPTGSTYATGYLSNSGFVATYPVSAGSGKDLSEVDPARAYHPLCTILEAARLEGKSTGLVVTSQFTHATPADFAAHTPDRQELEGIALQMVHNHLNVVFGGGLKYLDPLRRTDGHDLLNELRIRKYRLVSTRDEFDRLTPADTLVFGLFTEDFLPNDLDRDPQEIPSLAEMTRAAIRILAGNRNGFFLLVEGSKIDWAAHLHDPVGIVTEYLAFDDAVKEAMAFAGRDGYTAVVVVPDHGTGGISLGNSRSDQTYDELPLSELTEPVRRPTRTAEGIARLILAEPAALVPIFRSCAGIDLSAGEMARLQIPLQAGDEGSLAKSVAELLSRDTYVGFTTHGHTAEDVVLAVYHPMGYRPTGVVKNTELHRYMTGILGSPDLDSLTAARYCIDTMALNGLEWELDTASSPHPTLIIRAGTGSNRYACIEAGTDFLTLFTGRKPGAIIPFRTLALYVKPLRHFFLPRDIRTYLPGGFCDSEKE